MLGLANVLFFVFHTAWVVFNLTGWAWRTTRPYQLATLALTAFSWFGLGAVYGVGYCLCTDLHLRIRREMGLVDPDDSYICLLVRTVTGLELDRPTGDWLAVTGFLWGVLLGVGLTLKEHYRARKQA